MKRYLMFTSACLVLFCSGAAMAQHGGNEQEQRACAGNVKRYCRAVLDQGDFAVLGCLQQNRSKLTAACSKVLSDHGQ